ncbi:MAG: hypothetical protein DLM61_27945, partial [Pseudonocardiales bacterium]
MPRRDLMTVLSLKGGTATGRLAGLLPRTVVEEPPLFLFVTALALAYAVYAVIQHDNFRTGLDLGIFDQALWHYSRFEAPASTLLGLSNLLGDHFHPILVVLAPLYWVWSDARVLLIAQAVLVAASVVPVFLFARARVGRVGAYLLALSYGTFWGLQAGISYDFHEVAFAPLLIALAILFIDRRRWGPYFVIIALLLCVKEDQALLVCFFGVYLATMREYRRGAITFAAGIVWYLVVTNVVFPALSPTGAYTHWAYPQFGKDLPHALLGVLDHPLRVFEVLFDSSQKVKTLFYLLVAFLGLALRSRLAILLGPLIAARFLSSSSQFWQPYFHYSMTIAPVLAMGAATGLAGLAASLPARWRPAVLRGGALATLTAGIIVTAAVPQTPLKQVVKSHAHTFDDPPYAPALRAALARVPPHASVMAVDPLVPHLTRRKLVTEIEQGKRVADYLVTNVVDPVGSPGPWALAGGFPDSYAKLQGEVLNRLGYYEPIFLEDGWFVGRRRGAHGAPRPAGLAPASALDVRALVAADISWERARASALSDVLRCTQLGRRHDGATHDCWGAAGTDLRRRRPVVAALLASVAPRVGAGCGILARAALVGTATFGQGVE